MMRISNQMPPHFIRKERNDNQPKNTKLQDTVDDLKQREQEQKQALKESIQRQVLETKMKRGENNPKAQRIIAKFHSGKKLTPMEMQYIRKHAPDQMETIIRITREREMTKMLMSQAASKNDVQMVVLSASQQIKNSPSASDRELRMKHLQNAKYEYEKTEEYKKKPNTQLEAAQEKKRPRTRRLNDGQHYNNIDPMTIKLKK